MPREIRNRVFSFAVIALPLIAPHNHAAAASTKAKVTAETIDRQIEKEIASVQLVTFPDTGWNAVKVVRGKTSAENRDGQKPRVERAEVVTFADSQAGSVRVLRGETDRTPTVSRPPSGMRLEIVRFYDPRAQPVSIWRGSGLQLPEFGLFGPAPVAELDRIAFAVDGAESRHGADLRMWRAEPGGPQGPMQVTAAAALDVGGGDRFDLTENRALGRAYLARLYRRYGNWPDAIAAYNWGPGNLDAWIAAGRAAYRLPLEVERYRNRVLHEAGDAIRTQLTTGPESDSPVSRFGSSRDQTTRSPGERWDPIRPWIPAFAGNAE